MPPKNPPFFTLRTLATKLKTYLYVYLIHINTVDAYIKQQTDPDILAYIASLTEIDKIALKIAVETLPQSWFRIKETNGYIKWNEGR